MCASPWCAEQHDRCGLPGESTARWGKLGEVSGSVGGRIPNILRADTHQPSILQVLTSRMASEYLAHRRLSCSPIPLESKRWSTLASCSAMTRKEYECALLRLPAQSRFWVMTSLAPRVMLARIKGER